MKKSQMCFPLSLISLLFIIATGIMFITLGWEWYNGDESALMTSGASGVGLVFAIASLIRAKIEKSNPSTLRTTGILISLICTIAAIAAIIYSCTFF